MMKDENEDDPELHHRLRVLDEGLHVEFINTIYT
jgi:hypothetical protein